MTESIAIEGGNAMSDVQIRKATENDQAIIRQMVKEERLDPTSLNWPQFLVAEEAGAVIGIGQIRPYPKCRELGSLAVKEAYRKQGVGERLVEALLANESGDVYLECLSHNEHYYAKFGFQRIAWWQAPMPLRLKVGFGVIGRLFGFRVIAMKRSKP
jgi:amino-acid N-acetyltransferase